MEQRRLSMKEKEKRRSNLRGKQKSKTIEPIFQSNPNSEGLSMFQGKQKAQNEILRILSKNLIKDEEQKQKQRFAKLKYDIPVQQQFALRQQRSNGQRFLNKQLVDKFILLIFMMVVMVLLGVVTPNTIFANRRPEERYAINNKAKNLQIEASQRLEINRMNNMQFLNQMNGNHENHITIYHPLVEIPQQTKIGLKSKQNNILFRPNKRNSDEKYQFHSFDDQYSFKRPISQILSDLKEQNNVESSFLNNSNVKQSESTDLSIKLMQVTHNVDYRGRVFLDQESLLKQEQSVQNILEKHKRIRQLVQEEKQVYEKNYQFSAYLNQQIRFCIVVNLNEQFYENKLYFRVLDSIFQQEYQNYHVLLIDDSIEERYFNKSVQYMIDNQIPTEKYSLVKNLQPKGIVHNIFMAVDKYCHQGQVVIPINNGQALIGRQTLALLNSLYQKHQSAVVIPSFVSIKKDSLIDIGSTPLDPQNISQDQNMRTKKDICNIFPITFYADLFKKIDPQDFIQNDQLKFYQQPCAYTLPILQMAVQNTLFVPQLAFQIRQSVQSFKYQQKQITQILEKSPYQKLTEINFTKKRNQTQTN